MYKHDSYKLILLLFASLLMQPVQAAEKIKCWTNEDGNRECGNTIPPQYSQKGFEVFDEKGLRTREEKRAKTTEEVAKERQIAEDKAAEEVKRKKQEAEDQTLLKLFGSEEDIETARTAKTDTIKAAIGSIDSYIASLKKNLADLQKNLEEATSRKQAAVQLDKIKQDIAGIQKRIKDSEETRQTKLKEIEDSDKEYAEYRRRFKDIKIRAAAASNKPATPAATPPSPTKDKDKPQ